MNLRIVTFYIHQNNVGQRLQSYALQQFIYRNFNEKALIYDITSIPEFKKRFNYNKYNYKFNFDKHLYIKKINSITDYLQDNVDYFIMGSDQIINLPYMGLSELEQMYYTLDLIEQKKKIPYALSFKDCMKYGIKTKTISFREDITREELDSYGYSAINNEINIHIDPTFLLDESDYLKYSNFDNYNIKIFEDKNCFEYRVPQSKLQVEDFIYQIKNYNGAIQSNSYHAFCFSVIFNKKINLYSNNLYLDKRVKQIIKTLNIKYEEGFRISNYDEVRERILNERKRTLNYFTKNLVGI